MPRAAPTARAGRPVARPRLRAQAARPAASATPSRGPTCRSWCASRCGSRPTRRSWSPAAVRLVLQVHDEQNPLHLCDAAVLWTGDEHEHGFGDRARTHAAIALRGAAEAWPVLDRLLELRVPDQITLDGDELESLLEDGVAALAGRGVDVLWPRSLGRDLTATTVLDRARPMSRARGPAPHRHVRRGRAVQLPLAARAARRPADRGRDGPAGHAARRRCSGCAATGRSSTRRSPARPASAWSAPPRRPRRSRRRSPAWSSSAPPSSPSRSRSQLGASLLKVRERLLNAAAAAAGRRARRAARHAARLPAPGADLAGRAHLARPRRLPGRRHGARQDDHPDRPAPAPRRGGSPGPTLVVCPASLLGNWEQELARFAPGVAVRRFHGERPLARRARRAGSCSRRTAPCGSATRSSPRCGWDLVVADEAQHVKNARSSTAKALRRIPSAVRVALTGTPMENNLTELWAILDWVIPGLLGSRQAFRRVWASPIEAGRARDQDPAVRGPDRAVPAAPPQVRPRHRARAAGQDRDRPPAAPDPRAGGALRVVRPRHDGADRAGRPRRPGDPPRPGAGAAHRAQADLQPPGALPQGVRRRSGSAAARRSSTWSTSCSAPCWPRTARRWSSPSTSRWRRLLEAHLAKAGIPHQFLHGGTPVREREAMVARFQARRGAGVPALAQGRRHRPQPHPRRPRHPLRPLVEPGRRGAGHRPRLPDRADPAGPGAPAGHPGHDRGAGRRAARAQARAGRRRARPRRGRADRARRRRAARPGHAAPRGRPPRAAGTSGRDHRRPPAHARPAAAPRGRRAGGRRPGSARSRRRRTPRPTWPPRAPSRGPGGSARSASSPAGSWPPSRTSTGSGRCSGTVPVLDAVAPPRRWSRRWPPRPAGWRRCWPATCRTRWSSTPRRPASSCCPTAASSARPAPARPGPTRARTRWR